MRMAWRTGMRRMVLLFALAHNLMRTVKPVPALLRLDPTASARSAAAA
jgi:hypothetical protein